MAAELETVTLSPLPCWRQILAQSAEAGAGEIVDPGKRGLPREQKEAYQESDLEGEPHGKVPRRM